MSKCSCCGSVVSEDLSKEAPCPTCGCDEPGSNGLGETILTPQLSGFGVTTALPANELEDLWRRSISSGFLPEMTIKNAARQENTPSRITVKVRSLLEPGQEAPEMIVPAGGPDFELLQPLGEGGVGIVFEARQTSCDRTIAIKMLLPTLAQDPDQRACFLYEGTVTADLEHPNIVPIHDLGQDEQGHPFYAMKRVQGTPWSRVLSRRSQEENLETLMDVADAVAFSHNRGVIHRDLKPENVMLGDFGEVLVMDWGLAVSHNGNGKAGRLNPSVAVAGTPCYMAPEMAAGRIDKIGPASDIYLLGAVLYEICTGRPPHPGTDVLECLRNAAANVIQPADAENELVHIALKAMSTEPEHRYPCVKDFQHAIRDYESHAESMAFCSRACELAQSASSRRCYDEFGKAIFTFEEALRLWTGNATAQRGLARVRQLYAEVASERGDLELAESLLHVGGLLNTPIGHRIQTLRREREALVVEQEALRASAEKWARAFLMSPDSVVVTRLSDGVILEVNDVFLHSLRLKREEVVGRNSDGLDIWTVPEDRDNFLRTLRAVGRVENLETAFRARDGREFPALVSARVIELDGIHAVVSHTRDITERKRAEEGLRMSERRLRQTQRLARLGTWDYNLDSGDLCWSEETFRIAGLDPAEKTPSFEQYLAMLHADDVPQLLDAIERLKQEGLSYEIEIRHHRPDGAYIHALAQGEPVVKNGRVVEVLGSLLDITDRRRTEQALLESERQCRLLLSQHETE